MNVATSFFQDFFHNKAKGHLKLCLLASDIPYPNSYPVINVVGTNGKGSTAFGLHQILQKHYTRIGLFTSPAVFEHNERIRLNNQLISDHLLRRYYVKYYDLWSQHRLNFFEVWTFMGFAFFAEQNVEIAIVEAGIGGRLDCTNLFHQQKAVILTSIALDHTQILGNNLASICWEKIGIMHHKTTTPLFVAHDNYRLWWFIKQYCHHAILSLQQSNVLSSQATGHATNLYLLKTVCDYFNWDFHKLNQQDYLPPGRFVHLPNYPQWIIDGAHNLVAIQKIITYAEHFFGAQKFYLLCGFAKHKNFYRILDYLKLTHYVVFVTAFHHRKSWSLAAIDDKVFLKINNWEGFLHHHQKQPLLICGSFYFIGQVLTFLKQPTPFFHQK